jgi:UbiD family decarboxylase
MWAAWAADPALGKITVVVDDDIDIRDEFSLFWAMSWTVQPERDVYLASGTPPVSLDPSQASVSSSRGFENLSSKLGIDATRKHAYPPRSGPPSEHRSFVDSHWAEYGID